MPREINFLSERRKDLSKVEKQDWKIMRIVVGVFGVVLAVFVVILGAHYYITRQLSQIQAAQQSARAQIASNQEIERSFVIFVHKLSTLSKIDQDREQKKATIEFMNSVFGQNILVKGIEFDQGQKLLIFRLESADVFALRRVFELVNSPTFQERFASVNLSDLNRNAEGNYELAVALVNKSGK